MTNEEVLKEGAGEGEAAEASQVNADDARAPGASAEAPAPPTPPAPPATPATPAAERKTQPTLRLAHHPTLLRAKTVEEGGGTEKAWREPVTIKGEVNIYGFPPIFFPSLEDQRSGFTPYFVAMRDGRPAARRYNPRVREREADERGEEVKPLNLRDVKTAAGVTLALDADSAQEATRIVREHFAGIYKPADEKGA